MKALGGGGEYMYWFGLQQGRFRLIRKTFGGGGGRCCSDRPAPTAKIILKETLAYLEKSLRLRVDILRRNSDIAILIVWSLKTLFPTPCIELVASS